MSGCELPVVINSGSGNQGLAASLPVIEYAKELKCSKERLYRALVLSNLIAIHLKTGLGRLSAYCGAVSAGSGAGCGIAWLKGADLRRSHIRWSTAWLLFQELYVTGRSHPALRRSRPLWMPVSWDIPCI